ncbi:serine/threonine-protein kinase [Streptomyces iconiensis]|uniref:non-specific serine/threonine protein kinase n=1 Tax=Streptomyces iconiensis TaxID=1384038 RepID=A0ABT7A3N6_9ACTN|nr:serine/threonine-protein kinase [Streptomyces iconiensis]MDJ1135945.1 serine/threonine-protein kinase [Streptomyces iconiensis]
MTNQGDRSGEPTSYGLQPPGVPQQGRAQGVPAGYEPTQAAVQPDVAQGPAAAEGEPGVERLVGGRYRLMSRLGHGGMGTVWRAHDEVVDRDVAVKEPRLPGHLVERERQTMYERMRREARTAARIEHPSVVTIHDVVIENGQPWIVMELVQGRSLADVLQEGTVDVREAARIGLAVAGALDAAHGKGVLHRDVKPDNVLLGRYDRVVLSDFGIAQVQGEQGLTETGAFVGSPEFVAPERVLGQRPGPESDLWSLGVVLYAATEGVSPFRRSNSPATLQAVLSAEPQRPTRALSSSGAFGMLLTRLLNKEPGLRPDAQEVRQTLMDVARPPQQQLKAVRDPAADNAVRRMARGYGARMRTSRAWQFGTGGAVVALAAAVTLLLVLTGERLPDGWKTRDESKRVGATLAVPGDFERSAKQNEVTFTDPGDDFTIQLTRSAENIKGNSLEEANSWKDYYEDGAEVQYSDTMGRVRSAVEDEVVHQGKKAAIVRTTYKEVPDGASGPQGPYLRRHELVYVNPDDERWRLVVDMPARGGDRKEGERIFEEAVKTLKIKEL